MSQPPADAPLPPPLPGGGTPADPSPPAFPEIPTRPEGEPEASPAPMAQAPLDAVLMAGVPEAPGPVPGHLPDAELPAIDAAAAYRSDADPAPFVEAATPIPMTSAALPVSAPSTTEEIPVPTPTTTAALPVPAVQVSRLAALRARINLFGEAVYVRIRWHLRELLEDLRTRDRFFRWKAAIVAGWIALSFVSLGVARSGAPAGPGVNRLQAYVVIRPTTMGWGLLVHNQSRTNWRGVEIRLDGYTHRVDAVAAGEQLILGPFQFERDGQALPSAHVPHEVEIAAAQGTMVLSLVDEEP